MNKYHAQGGRATRSQLRLTLAGFSESEASDVELMVRVVADIQAPWMVVYHPPYDAVLLARGTREQDADNVSVLRVASEVQPQYGSKERRQLPLLLPRPIHERTLRLALEAAIERLRDHGLDPRRGHPRSGS